MFSGFSCLACFRLTVGFEFMKGFRLGSFIFGGTGEASGDLLGVVFAPYIALRGFLSVFVVDRVNVPVNLGSGPSGGTLVNGSCSILFSTILSSKSA